MYICNEEGLNLDAQVFKLALFVMNQMMFICIIHYYDNIGSIVSSILSFNNYLGFDALNSLIRRCPHLVPFLKVIFVVL